MSNMYMFLLNNGGGKGGGEGVHPETDLKERILEQHCLIILTALTQIWWNHLPQSTSPSPVT